MGGSTADTPASPEFLRASDAERDHAVSELRNEFTEGRLSHETFMYRMQSALDARNRGQLAGLFTDLPLAAARSQKPQISQSCWPGSGPPCGARPRSRVTRGRRRIRAYRGSSGSSAPRPGQGRGRCARMQRHQDSHFSPAAPPPGAAADPAPLAFPPGSGVRFTIGRTRDCDLCLTDLSVSRMHALLVRREDGWVLSDLGSHNGTRLNGWLVREPVQVHAGDRVEFGSMAFIIQGDPPAELPAPEG